MVEVTESARRAAGSICVGAELRALILEGNFDDHDYVQAFAQAEARGREQVLREVIALLDLCCDPCNICHDAVAALTKDHKDG